MICHIPRILGTRKTILLNGVSAGCLGIVVLFLALHARAIRDVRDISVPLVAELPSLERQLSVLKDQIELSELHAADRTGSEEERIAVYVLPASTDLDRTLAAFEALREYLSRAGMLAAMSPVDFGSAGVVRDGLAAAAVRFDASLTEEGMTALLRFVRLAGLLTVGDAFSEGERERLLHRTEEDNPAGIVALEQFFAADVLDYAENPRLYDTQLLRSYSGDAFRDTFSDVVDSSLLRGARELLGGSLGRVLRQNDLWPTEMMMLDGIDAERGGAEGWVRAKVRLSVYSRK